MARIKPYSIPIKERREIIGDFFALISNLKTKQEIIDLFVGLLTPGESLMLARRLKVAKLILDDKKYEEIRKEMGVGFETISKVERWLYERDEAYKNVIIKRWKKEGKNNKNINKNRNYTGLNRYPQHRFLKELLGL
jgi:TrpR-related protein YerC/YecD